MARNFSRYGRDFDLDRGWNRDLDWDRGYTGRGTWDRGYYGTNRGYDVTGGYAGGRGMNRGEWTRGYDMTFRAGRGYDRDLGDRMREGWNDLKRNARDLFNRDYDRDFGRGYRGSEYRGSEYRGW